MNKVKGAVSESFITPDKLIGYQEIGLYMIFDVKLGENFRRKARMVAGGHKTITPSSVIYSSVVSRNSVRIMLMIASLNDLDIQAANIENAYLTAPCRKKIWTRAGPEFGIKEGKVLIIDLEKFISIQRYLAEPVRDRVVLMGGSRGARGIHYRSCWVHGESCGILCATHWG